jgi:hypothetical protein
VKPGNLSIKTRKHSIRRTHFNLATDFKYNKLTTRLLPTARATIQLQLQLPLPSPAQQPVQQKDQEGQEKQQNEGTKDVLQPDPLAKRLAAFYAIHNPRKLLDPSFVIDCANRYQDEPDQLEQILVRHYQVGLRSLTQQQEQQQRQQQQPQPSSATASPHVLSESALAIRMSAFYSLHNPDKRVDIRLS